MHFQFAACRAGPGTYSLVFNAICCLLTESEQVACFRNAARHLAPGGRFAWRTASPGLRERPPGQHAVVWKSEPGYIGLDTDDVLHQHLVSCHVTFSTGRDARVAESLRQRLGRHSSSELNKRALSFRVCAAAMSG